MDAKPVSASRVILSQVMGQEHANLHGNVHGGWLMKLVDEAGGLACTRHARCNVVTVVIDTMTFKEPVHIGDLLILKAEVTYTGRTSMETRVEVTAENPLTGERTHTNTAYVVYVAIDDNDRPAPVPPLLAETDEERARMERAHKRQEDRLARQREKA